MTAGRGRASDNQGFVRRAAIACGVALLVVAASRSVLIGVRRWRNEQSPAVAAVCLAATLGIVAVFTKAMLEPALEWYRLSSLLGFCLGIVLIADRRNKIGRAHV